MTDREDLRAKMEGLRASLRGGVSVVSAPSLFPTPDDVADRLAQYAALEPGCRVLEPSCGTGSIVRALLRSGVEGLRVQAFDVSNRLASTVNTLGLPGVTAAAYDFLEQDPEPWLPFDRVVMNPPFDRGADIKHVRHALRFLAPGGVLVAIVAGGPRQTEAFKGAERLEELPSGTFAGTGVRSVVIRYRGQP